MKFNKFSTFIITESWKQNEKAGISIYEPPLVGKSEGNTYSGGRTLHPNIPL